MDWTHTEPSESVWNGVSLSGEKDHQKKHQHRRSKREYEKEVEDLKKELANCKLQLETKHAAYMQALRKVEHYQRLNSELFSLLKKSDSQRKGHMNEGNDRGSGTGEIESMMKEVNDQSGNNPKFREQISQLWSEFKTRERMLLNKEVELLAAKDSELKAQTKIEEMEAAFNNEKQEKQLILQKLEELKVEKQRENHNDKGQKERKSTDQTLYIEALETEWNQLKQEPVNAKNQASGLNSTAKSNKIKEKDIEEWVQGALLTTQLPKGEAAEENNTDHITIPLKEYESFLIRKVEQLNEAKASMAEGGSLSETAMLKMEVEAATEKIGGLRARAEQALSRAELAEKAKADIEHKLRRRREKKQRRKAAMAALEEESTPSQFTPSGATPQVYEPLSKILNLNL